MRFARRRGGVEARPDEVEVQVLSQAVQDLLRLLGSVDQEGGDGPGDQDPLAALVGLPGADVERPRDPALARLFPDAYGDDDPRASAEFRRYTQGDLSEAKRAGARTVLATLARGPRLHLDGDEARAWLGTLNDLRLVLGTRLDVSEDLDADDLDADDPRLPALHLYGWLGWLQESLVRCLEPRR